MPPGLRAFDGSTAVGWCLLAPHPVSWDSWAAPVRTGSLVPGVAAGFARHGFEVIARRRPGRPVMRRLGVRPAGQAS